MKSWSLASHIVAGVVAIVFGCLVLLSVSVAAFTRHEVTERLDDSLQEVSERLGFVVSMQFRQDQVQGGVALPPGLDRDALAYQITDLAGHIVLRSQNAPPALLVAPLTPGFFDRPHFRVFVTLSAKRTHYILVAEPAFHRQEAIRRAIMISVLPMILIMPAIWLLVRWTVRRALRPLVDLQKEIGSRGGANLEPIPSLHLPDEAAPIHKAVNSLLDRLRKALSTERMFATNAAHELRNPIAALMAQAQVLHEDLRESGYAARLESVVGQTRRISRTTEKLLQLSRATSGVSLRRIQFDLIEIILVLVDEFRDIIPPDRRLIVDSGCLDHLHIQGDVDTCGILFRNLIENAINHGVTNTDIKVSIMANGQVEIVNACETIPAAVLDRLAEPFIRGASSTEGSGLGLSIAHNIVTQLGCQMALLSPAPGQVSGFMARISFPVFTVVLLSDHEPQENE
ncbi:HAMP domain-containing histidine kinase [Gluconacetobacter azotocaptans]|uniref:histidine kinase n=1 Tax=Gluconacetobacter azotocaptans TaxID=142834 RepID=A0A7W4PFG6_9PROT|nr:HAMP domain-containing sensor histidine kinase [Gluconacetobacter azotocaptans]MBB2188881.1 HAMP domain-containing histidine kinase [Gluconacetobacter azotocaptans]GBQ30968.1 two component sensor histidine kinase [Gluconacetobacter azotocaptans DSM 13594]